MRYTISGKNIDITPGLREAAESKIGKLDRYFSNDTEVQITMSVEKGRQKIEVTIPVKGTIIRAEQDSNDMYVSIDLVEEIIERQIKKYKTKLVDKKQSALSFSDAFLQEESEHEEAVKIVKTKRFAMKPMDPEEACVQMELLGHNFFMFLNADTNEVNVVYKPEIKLLRFDRTGILSKEGITRIMKISIVYHSCTGRTAAMAEIIKMGMEQVEGVEAVLIPVDSFAENEEAYTKELNESVGVVFGTPDYYASESWQMKKWLDTCPVSLGGKLGGAFATSNVPQGGPVTAIESILTQLIVKGMLVYSGGTSLGKPFVHLGPIATGTELSGSDLFPVYGKRFASKAKELFH